MAQTDDEVWDWLSRRPAWQGQAYARLWQRETLTVDDCRQIAEQMIRGEFTESSKPASAVSGTGAEHDGAVVFESVRIISNVNSLPADEKLTFAEHGITLIYGQNGSGKSGYARILKAACLTNPPESLYPNVYATSGAEAVEAEITVRVGGRASTSHRLTSLPLHLNRAHFFDSACCTDYIHRESSLEYQSRAVGTLKELVRIFDLVRQELDHKIQANENRKLSPLNVSATGSAQAFLDALADKTTHQEIVAACTKPDDLDADRKHQQALIQSLENEDQNVKRAALSDQADACAQLIEHLERLQIHLGPARLAELTNLVAQADRKRASAQLALQDRFSDVPMRGVGTSEWIELWNAARQVSTRHAYPDHDFPHRGEQARCVLCQQLLSDEAKERMRSFEETISENLNREAMEIDQKIQAIQTDVKNIVIRSDVIDDAVVLIGSADERTGQRIRRTIAMHEQSQVAVASGKVSDVHDHVQADRVIDLLSALHSLEDERRAAADEILTGAKTDQITAAKQKMDKLDDMAIMAASFKQIVMEVERLKERAHLDKCKGQTNTGPVSNFISDLTDEIVKDRVDTFADEAHALSLARTTLKDIGSRKGERKTRIDLAGKQLKIEPWLILSEGEQRAAGLARYFTDVKHAEDHSALVLDDPVSSLDHQAREAVATRIVTFAQDRQVIIFTHDLTLIVTLHEIARQQSVKITTRSVQRDGASGMPGMIRPDHPWEASDAKARFDQLVKDARYIKNGRADWDDNRYADEVALWAGRLSESLERAVRRIVGRVVNPVSSYVRPDLFHTLARITEQDDRDFQRIYSLTSKWSRRHDMEPSLNHSAPSVEEVERVAVDAQQWFKTVSSHVNQKT